MGMKNKKSRALETDLMFFNIGQHTFNLFKLKKKCKLQNVCIFFYILCRFTVFGAQAIEMSHTVTEQPSSNVGSSGPMLIDFDKKGKLLGDFKEDYKQATCLRLEKKKLEKIPECLSFFERLQEIKIKGCQVRKFNLRRFKHLKLLKKVEVDECLQIKFPRNGWGHVSGLTDLIIRGIPRLKYIPDGVRTLRCLININFSNNNLLRFNPMTFESSKDLQKVDISGNKRIEIYDDGWSCVPNLQELNLSKNNLMRLPSGLNLLACLKRLNISGNVISCLRAEDFVDLADLRRLNLSDNDGIVFVGDIWAHLTKLKTLQMAGIGIFSLPAGIEKLQSLTTVDISKNKIEHLDMRVLARMQKLKHIKAHNNRKLRLKEDGYNEMPQLVTLDLKFCDLVKLPFFLRKCENLERLNFRRNQIKWFNPQELKNSRNLKYLNLSGNMGLKFYKSGWKVLVSLETLNISHTNQRFMPAGISDLPNVKKIIASSNDIKVIRPGFFERLAKNKNLKKLDLRKNMLFCLPRDVLLLKETVDVIDLRGNTIRAESNEFFLGKEDLIKEFGDKIKID